MEGNVFKRIYRTPKGLDDLIMVSEGGILTGLSFFDCADNKIECEEKELPVFRDAKKWLDIYFSGKAPDFMPEFKINDLTPFRKEVSDIMLSIPFGKTMTYGGIAALVAQKRGIKKMSAQAVGGAVGWNPLCIIVPCHRVLGADKSLTGYGGGIKNKIALLELEGIEFRKP